MNAMNFDRAVNTINKLLEEKRPDSFTICFPGKRELVNQQ
jgi:hypothetical protein